MFIVLNKCYGRFGLSDGFLRKYPEYKESRNSDECEFRTDKKFIQRIRDYGIYQACGDHANLSIVSIPDDITDYRLREYDGYEYIEYVKNGKIFDA